MHRLYLKFPVIQDTFPQPHVSIVADLGTTTPGRPRYMDQSLDFVHKTAAFGIIDVHFGNTVVTNREGTGYDESFGWECDSRIEWYNPKEKNQPQELLQNLVESHREEKRSLVRVVHGPIFRYKKFKADGISEYWIPDPSKHITGYLNTLQTRLGNKLGLEEYPHITVWDASPQEDEVAALKIEIGELADNDEFEKCARLRDLVKVLQKQIDQKALIQGFDPDDDATIIR
tara:strand:- start:6090 stop:6779 length:690 start_codon:yes stop_codon:yes gene_type:complete